ncbi:MAG: S8 family serine peptidase, partial [Devosia sp.]
MTNTSSNTNILSDLGLEITSQSIAALTNPAINGSEYWNLTKSTQGSANFHAAWNYATGAGVTIGLVDEGVNYAHLDLAGNYDVSIDFDPRDDIAAFDAHPDSSSEVHGTEVAGVIAGSAANDFGTIGAAPEATITASYLRYGNAFSLDEIGAIFAHQSAYDVSNNSWGFTAAFADNFSHAYFAPLADGIEAAASSGRGGLGTAMVFAAGNGKLMVGGQNIGDDSNFHSLSNSRFGIAVGAHDSEGRAAVFSSPGSNVLISAPGVGLLTTGGTAAGAMGSTYVSGTSFAAPMVSSAIALMLDANANLGYRDIQEILAISADPTIGPSAIANAAGNMNGGGLVFDREIGFGNLNALSAVSLARNWTAQSTAANEAHLSSDFIVPLSADPSSQSLSLDLLPTGTGFSLDHVSLTLNLIDADLDDLRIELTSAAGTTVLIAP